MITRLILLICLFSGKIAIAQDSTIVYFDFDKYELTSSAQVTLNSLVSKPGLYSAVIYGHTDQLGSNAYNDGLSVKRANAVRGYLAAKGVAPGKIRMVKGFGETIPVIDKLDEVSRQSNRRVVIITNYEVSAEDSVVMEVPVAKVPKTPTDKTPPSGNVRKPVKENLITEIGDTTTREGDNIILKNINFYGGRHVFLPQAYEPLNELLLVMQKIPTLEIEIQGHICCTDGGQDGLDLDTGEPFLSYNRARAVYDYLVEKGIDKKRMTYRGFGHKFPLIEIERSEDERTTNRRVEIKILKK